MKVKSEPVTVFATYLILTPEERDELVEILRDAKMFYAVASRPYTVLDSVQSILESSVR